MPNPDGTPTLAELYQYRAEAYAAISALMNGKRAVDLQFSDKRVSYAQVTVDQLRRYLADLDNQIAVADGTVRQKRAPFQVYL